MTQTEPNTKTALQRFTVQDATIAKMREEYMPLAINGVEDKIGAERVHKARMVCVKSRTGTEKVAKELNEEAREWIKTVNGEKNRILGLIEPIEDHLSAEERRIDAEKEAIRFKAQREEEERKRLAEEAERVRIKAEQDAENAKLAAERAELKRQQAELAEANRKQEEAHAAEAARLAAERKAIEDTRRKIEEAAETERKRIANAEAARLRKIEEDAKPKPVEQPQTVTAGFDVGPGFAYTATPKQPVKTMTPNPFAEEDRDKLLAVASCIRGIDVPMMSTTEGQAAATRVNAILDRAAAEIRDIAISLAQMPVTSAPVEDEEGSCPF